MNHDRRQAVDYESVSPAFLNAYLQANRWTVSRSQQGVLTEWTKPWRRRTAYVTVPEDSSYVDYSQRIEDAVKALAIVEKRSNVEMAEALLMHHSDVVHVCRQSRDSEDGTIALEKGAEVLGGIQNVLRAAGNAVYSRRPRFVGARTEQVKRFSSGLRLGQTKHGSYVFTVVSPITPPTPPVQPSQRELFPNNDDTEEEAAAFERKAMATLGEALRCLHGVLKSSVEQAEVNESRLQSAVADGVSVGLCEGLAAMSIPDACPLDKVRFLFRWAPGYRVATPAWRSISFSAGQLEAAKRVAEILKEAPEPQRKEWIVGRVVALRTISADEIWPEGPVTVLAEIDGRMRKVNVHLDRDEHKKAIEAYREGRLLLCHGRIVQGSNQCFMEDAEQVSVVDPSDYSGGEQ